MHGVLNAQSLGNRGVGGGECGELRRNDQGNVFHHRFYMRTQAPRLIKAFISYMNATEECMRMKTEL